MTKQSPHRKLLKRQIKILGMINRHASNCYKNITLTIANDGLGHWQKIIAIHMQELVKEITKAKP